MKSLACPIVLALASVSVALTPARGLAQGAGAAQPATKPAETKPADAKPAAAAPGAATVDAEARKVLDASKAAVAKVRDISFKIKQQGASPEGTSTGTMTISIPEKAGMGMPFDKYRAMVTDDKGKVTSEWAMDGKTITRIDHAAKKVLSMEVKNAEALMPPQELWGLMPQWLFEGRMEMPGLKTTGLTLGADEEVGGVKCRVLTHVEEMEMPQMAEDEGGHGGGGGKVIITHVKHLGVQDMLPRKVVLEYKTVGGGEDRPEMKIVSEMADVKANAGLKDADFALKVPEGFTTEAGTYESMGLQDPAAAAPELKAEVGSPAVAFKLKDAKGNEVSLESLKGRVVLLDFWATWCGPCRAAMPSIQKLHERFADKPVTVIGMNCWEQKDEAAVAYMEKKKFTYTLLLKADDLAKAYGISGIPTLILIDRDGKVLHSGVGFGPGEEDHLAEMIQKELDRK
jgi:thiol-disulfide isomerase/thioredoxin